MRVLVVVYEFLMLVECVSMLRSVLVCCFGELILIVIVE